MLLYEELPTEILVGGESYSIITDFREWIRLIDLVESDDINTENKARLVLEWYKEEIPYDTVEAIKALTHFLKGEYPQDDTGTETGKKTASQVPVFSYSYDAEAIYVDFMRVYGIDLLDVEYMHWWKFKALSANLPEDSEFKRRIYYRSVNLAEIENKKERDRIAKIKNKIALPATAMTDEDIGNAFW